MKKILVVVFIFSSTFCFSQRVEVFAIGGLNGSTVKVGNSITSDYSRIYSPTIGFFGGLGSPYVLGEVGVLYSAQGARINVGSKDTKVDFKLHSIDVPVMAVVAPENFRFFLGPQISFLSAEKTDTSGMEVNKKALWSLKPKDYMWSIRFGAGYERRRLLIQLHFVNGISNILNESAVDVKIRTFQISLGYLLFSNFGRLEGTKDKKKEDDLIPSHRVID
jgi:hypothetical protein